MHRSKLPSFARWIGVLAAVVAAAGISLELWCALDRAQGAPARLSPDAAARAVLERPSAATFSRLARVDAADGNTKGAAYAAAVAARLRPDDRQLAVAAERAVDAAARAELRTPARPATAAAIVGLAGLGLVAWRRRRAAAALATLLSGARGRLRIAPEGSRPAPGNEAMVDEGTRAIVIDAEFPAALAHHAGRPTAVAYLSNSTANRTVRLSPRSDLGSGAVRWRIEDGTLAAIAGHAGRWRVVLRVGAATLADASFLVTPSARRRAAA